MFDVLKKAFKETNKGKVLKFFFSSIGALNVILQIGKVYLGLDLISSIIWGLIGSFTIYFLIFSFKVAKHYYKVLVFQYRDSIYGDAIIFLKDAFAQVHHLRKAETIDDAKFKNTMAYVCQQLKFYFDKKSNTKCAISIKLIKNYDGNKIKPDAQLFNLCRDKDSTKRDTDTYKSINHSIFNNTCFNHIFTNITQGKVNKLFYLNINMPKTVDYQNTSSEVYGESSEVEWKLPYKSELVVPILPQYREESREYNLIGFICADSAEIESFDSKYDLAMLQGVADGIYDIIEKKNTLK